MTYSIHMSNRGQTARLALDASEARIVKVSEAEDGRPLVKLDVTPMRLSALLRSFVETTDSTPIPRPSRCTLVASYEPDQWGRRTPLPWSGATLVVTNDGTASYYRKLNK